MHSILEALLAMQRPIKDEYRARVDMPGTLRDIGYSEEMNVVLGMTTRWVASALETQYKVAVDEESVGRYAFIDNGETVTVRNDQNECLVEKASWSCDSEFALTMKLPFRHAMLHKRSTGSAFVPPFGAIPPRYVHVYPGLGQVLTRFKPGMAQFTRYLPGFLQVFVICGVCIDGLDKAAVLMINYRSSQHRSLPSSLKSSLWTAGRAGEIQTSSASLWQDL